LENSIPLVKLLDGRSFYYAFLAGAQRIFENQGLLNKMNVFPVADADTGTNLASTMRSIVDSPIPTNNVKMAAAALADAALVGARGNSGIIFAQFLYGFSNEIENEEKLTVENFSHSVTKAVTYAYEAIANPIEGTMISVIREWAEFINAMKGLIDDFVELLIKALQVARESLADTTRQLEALTKAHVVDAGAKGFVLFLEGMIDFFKNRQSIRRLAIPMNDMVLEDVQIDSHEDITFRYCCEAMLALDLHPGQTKDTLRDAITDMGDSMVVAGSEKRLRIHIHSDNPIKLFEAISKRSSITYQKVDDMIMQEEMSHNRKWDVALVTDSTCDLPQEFLEKYQISMVPLTLQVGASSFLDRTTIANEQFYNLLESSPVYPSTSQPAYKDFINKYSFLSSHYKSAIGIHLGKQFSGTFSNSQRAAKAVREQNGKEISVLNTDRVSSALGLVVLRAAEAIEQGKTHEEIVERIDSWSQKSHLLVSALTVKYLVKGGRLSHSKGFIGRLLGVRPIISINSEGKAYTFGKAYSEKGSMKLVMDEASRLIEKGKIWGYALSHVSNLQTAEWYAVQMELLTGMKPLFINSVSPVLAVHGGPGTVVLSIMEA
jgi:uncharacterized protein